MTTLNEQVCVLRISTTLKEHDANEITSETVIIKTGCICNSLVKTLKEDDQSPVSGKGVQEGCTNNRGREYRRRKNTCNLGVVFYLTGTRSLTVMICGVIGGTTWGNKCRIL